MSGWLIPTAYLAGYVLAYRKGYPILSASMDDWNARDRRDTAVIALLACLIWPVLFVGYLAWRFLTPVTPAERKAELDAREAEIARMERELGIGRSPR